MFIPEIVESKLGRQINHPSKTTKVSIDDALEIVRIYNEYSVSEEANSLNSTTSFQVEVNEVPINASLSIDCTDGFCAVFVRYYDPSGGNLISLEIGSDVDFYKGLVECAVNIRSGRFWDMGLEMWIAKSQLTHICFGARYTEEGYNIAGRPKMQTN